VVATPRDPLLTCEGPRKFTGINEDNILIAKSQINKKSPLFGGCYPFLFKWEKVLKPNMKKITHNSQKVKCANKNQINKKPNNKKLKQRKTPDYQSGVVLSFVDPLPVTKIKCGLIHIQKVSSIHLQAISRDVLHVYLYSSSDYLWGLTTPDC